MFRLHRIILDSGADGVLKVVERFHERHDSYPKRQIELAIEKLATKDKRENDSSKVWYIRPEYQHFVKFSQSATKAESGSSKKRARDDAFEPGSPEQGSAPSSSSKPPKDPKKFKRAFGFFVKDKRVEAERRLGADSEVRAILLLPSCVVPKSDRFVERR